MCLCLVRFLKFLNKSVLQKTKMERTVWKELINEIWIGQNPISFSNVKYIDKAFPHTFIRENMITAVLNFARPLFWVECGSLYGGSAIKTANVIKSKNLNTTIVCVDPFVGDVNTIAWEKKSNEENTYRFNRVEDGSNTIYERFRANVKEAGHEDIIVPIQATTVIGMRLFSRLLHENRLSRLPDVVYLDAAHEIDETMLELRRAWEVLPSKGVLFGDDWNWDAVRHDVSLFASTFASEIDQSSLVQIQSVLSESYFVNNVLLCEYHWFIIKK